MERVCSPVLAAEKNLVLADRGSGSAAQDAVNARSFSAGHTRCSDTTEHDALPITPE
jgi:hypothetical protein